LMGSEILLIQTDWLRLEELMKSYHIWTSYNVVVQRTLVNSG
jgi:hypothetical protein